MPSRSGRRTRVVPPPGRQRGPSKRRAPRKPPRNKPPVREPDSKAPLEEPPPSGRSPIREPPENEGSAFASGMEPAP